MNDLFPWPESSCCVPGMVPNSFHIAEEGRASKAAFSPKPSQVAQGSYPDIVLEPRVISCTPEQQQSAVRWPQVFIQLVFMEHLIKPALPITPWSSRSNFKYISSFQPHKSPQSRSSINIARFYKGNVITEGQGSWEQSKASLRISQCLHGGGPASLCCLSGNSVWTPQAEGSRDITDRGQSCQQEQVQLPAWQGGELCMGDSDVT